MKFRPQMYGAILVSRKRLLTRCIKKTWVGTDSNSFIKVTRDYFHKK